MFFVVREKVGTKCKVAEKAGEEKLGENIVSDKTIRLTSGHFSPPAAEAARFTATAMSGPTPAAAAISSSVARATP